MIQEEEFSLDDSSSEQGAQSSQTCLQMVEKELAEKQHDIEELTQELEEMRASFGTEGLKQVRPLWLCLVAFLGVRNGSICVFFNTGLWNGDLGHFIIFVLVYR